MKPALCLASAILALLPLAHAAEFRVLPAGEKPADARLQPLKELDGYFPFTPPKSVDEWWPRRERLKRQLLVSLGLWPLPTRTPLNARTHSELDMGDYTVEMVFFESMPGFYVTGNLYQPKKKGWPRPIVLSPYGHWKNGRFLDSTPAEVKRALESGGEVSENAARSPLQARCVQLARMGAAVFHYDMIGRGDATQIPDEVAHLFAKQRPETNTEKFWGLFSPRAESQAQNIMGLQTWNSMRALDFMLTLPDVNPEVVYMTGASGGATQTMLMGALDERVRAAFPAVMVSTAMQGGCTCENACGLRVGTGNVEIAGVFAPKRMGITAANDWTKEVATKGFPELQQLWGMMFSKDNLSLTANTQFPHNFNLPSRQAMYRLFFPDLNDRQPHFPGAPEPPDLYQERDFKLLSRASLTVWDKEHPAPAGGPEFERGLLKWWHDDAQEQLASPRAMLHLGAPALEAVLGRSYAEAGEVASTLKTKEDRGDFWLMAGLVENSTHGEKLPALFLHPKKWNGATILWLSDEGKSALLTPDGQPRPEVQALVAAGHSVVGADLLYQGEFLAPGEQFTQTPKSKNPREAAAYTFGYNHAVFAQRVHDVLSLRRLIDTSEHQSKRVAVIALGRTGPIVAAARALTPEKFDVAVLETGGFRFQQVSDLRDPMFLPGGAKYGDLPGMLSLAVRRPTLLLGEAEIPPRVRDMHEAERPEASFEVRANRDVPGALEWLRQQLR